MKIKKPRNTRLSRLSRIAVLLLAVTSLCVSTVLAGTTLAKFTSGTGGTDTVTVAVFAADAGSTDNRTLSLNNSDGITTAEYQFWVTNKENTAISDVAANYSVILTLPENFPDGVSIQIDDKNGTASQNGLTYTFTDAAWMLSPGSETKNTHTLTFTADFDVVVDDFNTSDIGLQVEIQQAD